MKPTRDPGLKAEDAMEERSTGADRSSRLARRFSQLAHEQEYEGEDVHLGSEAITVYAV